MKRKLKRSKLSAVEELQNKYAAKIGEWIAAEMQLTLYTAKWWRWTAALGLALKLERTHFIPPSRS